MILRPDRVSPERLTWSGFCCTLALASLTPGLLAQAQGVHVTTYHNDNARTGRNLGEKLLPPAKVDKMQFGMVARLKVDGDVYAQPLFLSGVPVGAAKPDLVFVSTQHDSVYAFDAKTGNQVWKTSFLPGTGVTTVPSGDSQTIDCGDISPEVGITGTPVIRLDPADLTRSTLYVVAKTLEPVAGQPSCVQRLHALSVVDGTERPNSPKLIASQSLANDPMGFPVALQTVSIAGHGTGSNEPNDVGKFGDNDGNGHIRFYPLQQHQRSGLLLSAGPSGDAVYVGWASHCDGTPYHGWLMGFDATTLAPTAVFNVTPNGGRAGIWAAGAAPAADQAGFIYFSTGNGTFDSELDRQRMPLRGNYGDSVLKLRVDPSSTPTSPNANGWGLAVRDYFTPFDQAQLGVPPEDFDLGSGGVILLDDQPGPFPHLMAVAGKKGVIYLLNRDNMGKFNPGTDTGPGRTVQRIPTDACDLSVTGDVWGVPALFGSTLYVNGSPRRDRYNHPTSAGGMEPLKAYGLSSGKLVLPPTLSPSYFFYKVQSPSVSADGSSGGVVWVIRQLMGNPGDPAVLHAFDASNIANELYNSEQAVDTAGKPRDRGGPSVKFTVPTVANGRVYVGCTGEVTVFGKLP